VTRLTDFRASVRLDELLNESAIAGLCANCKHVRRIIADRGSVFYLCQLSKIDARFPKYPRLPVTACEGFERGEGQAPKPRG
jgi:hypothetical protein